MSICLPPSFTPSFTLAIPTWNGAARLPQVFDCLGAQVGTAELAWEILIVDNNSSDATAAVVRQLQADWAETELGRRVPLRYCFEPRAGLAFARQRAMGEAEGAWVGFVDDDNWPEPGWVAAAIAFAHRNPDLGAFGSRIHPAYGAVPPEDFHQIEAFLAVRDHGEAHQFDPDQLQLPAGAGMVVHRQRWLDSVPESLDLVGRTADLMISGDDYAALLYLHRAGHGIAYNPAMVMRHAIPAQRLEPAYLLPLAYGIGLAICQLRFINARGLGRAAIALRTLVGGLRRMAYLLWCHGFSLGQNLNHCFYFCFFLGGALSPLLALSPRWGSWLKFQRIQALTTLWPLSQLLSRPTTPPPPSPAPWTLF